MARGRCGTTKQPVSVALAVSGSLKDIDDTCECPLVQVVRYRPLIERVFAEYQLIKRLNIRHDMTVPPDYLVALDVELQAINKKDYEHREKARKAQAMQSRRR